MILGLVICPLLTVLSAAGLRALAPRRAPGLYLWPATRTVVLLALPTAYAATIWSH